MRQISRCFFCLVLSLATFFSPHLPATSAQTIPLAANTQITATSIKSSSLRPTNKPLTNSVDLYLGQAGNPFFLGGPDPAVLPSDITYLLVVGNNASIDDVPGVSLTFTLPASSNWVSASGTNWVCNPSGGLALCTYTSPLPSGTETPDLEIVVHVDSTLASTITAQAQVWSNQTETNPSDNAATKNINVIHCNPNQPSLVPVSVSATSVPADGNAYADVFVQLRSDCPGNPLVTASSYLTLTSSRGGLDNIQLYPGYANPTTSGIIGFRVRSTTVGTSTYSAQGSTGSYNFVGSNTVTVNFTSCNRPSANASTVTASPTTVPPDGTSYATVVVTLRDDCNSTITASTLVTLTSSRGGQDTIALAPGSTNPTTIGSVSFRVRSTSLGTSTYAAQAQALNSVTSIVDTDNVTFCNLNQPVFVPLWVTTATVPADGSAYSDVFVQLRSNCPGKPLVTAASYLTVTSSRGGLDTLALTPGYANPTTSGTIAFRVRSTTVGTSTYSAQGSTGSYVFTGTNTIPVNFNSCNRPSPIASTVVATPTTVTADGSSYSLVTVTLNDDCNSSVTTSTLVTLTSSRGGQDTIALAPGSTNPTISGSVSFRVRSTNIGTSTYSALANALGTVANIVDTDNVSFEGCNPNLPDPALITLSPSVTSVPADGSTYSDIFVQLRSNCSGNPSVTTSSYLTLTSSRGGLDTITLAPGYANPTTNGVISFRVRSATIGASAYSVQGSTGSFTYTSTNTATVNFNSCNRPSPTASSVVANPTTVLADGTSYSLVTVTLNDDCANLVTASTWVTLTSSRGGQDTIALAPSATNPTTSGSVSFRVYSNTPGTSTYAAQANTLNTVVSLNDTDMVSFLLRWFLPFVQR